MSLSRSPSPRPSGGWSSPGLDSPALTSDESFATPSSQRDHDAAPGFATWEPAKARNQMLNRGAVSYQTPGAGFFKRHCRKISNSLPRFAGNATRSYAEKEKLGRGRWAKYYGARWSRWYAMWTRLPTRTKRGVVGLLVLMFLYMFWYWTRKLCLNRGSLSLLTIIALHYWWRRGYYTGGGKKFVVILAANLGGGVMEWKGPREWAIERDSVRNKRRYTRRWGYELEIVDMSTKKRYAHEWRESWEKADTIRNAMVKYPDAEWFWWMDLNTLVMEPSYDLQSHIFNNLAKHTYRDINVYNPLNITHPPRAPYLDAISQSAVGDGKPESINLVLSQDCQGFNLGSFFMRRSLWSDHLLDIWWDPVVYEQRHMEWEHKEQDALESLYINQPWIRSHTAFLPQRRINSFPPGACGDGNDTHIHYNEKERDFVLNMAGCEWGRDCWGEMYNYRELSYYLNRSWWERFKEDFLAMIWLKLTGRKVKF